eukprot:7386167-Ditylum_brightwellii.AAC.1
MPKGVRILTMFFYLNDVEDGGGTRFRKLDHLTFTPQKGMALLWPSVLDENPHSIDQRTSHEAMPVLKDTLEMKSVVIRWKYDKIDDGFAQITYFIPHHNSFQHQVQVLCHVTEPKM